MLLFPLCFFFFLFLLSYFLSTEDDLAEILVEIFACFSCFATGWQNPRFSPIWFFSPFIYYFLSCFHTSLITSIVSERIFSVVLPLENYLNLFLLIFNLIGVLYFSLTKLFRGKFFINNFCSFFVDIVFIMEKNRFKSFLFFL